jgi:TRAP-type C4-dicarboxylate transport system permease small subunit
MDYLARMIYSASRMLNGVSCVALVCMMGLVFINVVSHFLGHPIFGAYEFIGFLETIMIAFSIAYCATRKGHIAVSLVEDLLPKRMLSVFDTIVAILGTGLYLVLAWQCYVYAKAVWHSGEVSSSTEIPFYPLIFAIAFGFLLLALVLMADIFKSLVAVFRKEGFRK